MDTGELKYFIALQLTPMVGHKIARQLVAYCGSAEAIFKEKFPHLLTIPDIGQTIARSVKNFHDFERAEKEVEFVKKNNITATHFLSPEYPQRLQELGDAPLVLYSRGNADLNSLRVLGVVGTRRATEYGKEVCEKIVSQLLPYDVLVVSGLAFGIDHCAHRSSLKYNIPTRSEERRVGKECRSRWSP